MEYKGKIEIKYMWNGAKGNPIVYDGNSDGRWGQGKAILDGDNRTYDNAIVMLTHWKEGGLSHVEIKGFIIQGYAVSAITCNSSSHVGLSNMLIHELSNWDLSQVTNPKDSDARSGGGIFLRGTSNNIRIEDIEITKVSGTGIGIYDGVYDVDISNIRLHDYIVWQIDIAPRPDMTISDIGIHDSKLYNLYHYSNRYWARALIGTESHQHLKYTWTPSSKGENEYYVTLDDGSDPDITPVNELWYDYQNAPMGTEGRLKPGEWAYADNDALGFNTVYIRLSDGGDPDDLKLVEMINIVEARYDDEKVRPGSEQGIGNPHQDEIIIRNPNKGTISNLRIYSNDFYDETEIAGSGGTAMLFISQPRPNDSIYIYIIVFHPVHLTTVNKWLGSGGEVIVF